MSPTAINTREAVREAKTALERTETEMEDLVKEIAEASKDWQTASGKAEEHRTTHLADAAKEAYNSNCALGHLKQSVNLLKSDPNLALGWPGATDRLVDHMKHGLKILKVQHLELDDVDKWLRPWVTELLTKLTADAEEVAAQAEKVDSDLHLDCLHCEAVQSKLDIAARHAQNKLIELRERKAPMHPRIERLQSSLRDAEDFHKAHERQVAEDKQKAEKAEAREAQRKEAEAVAADRVQQAKVTDKIEKPIDQEAEPEEATGDPEATA